MSNQQYPLPWKCVPFDDNWQIQDANGGTVVSGWHVEQDTAALIVESVNSTLDKKIEVLVAEVKRLRDENATLVARAAEEKEAAEAKYERQRDLWRAYKEGVIDATRTIQ